MVVKIMGPFLGTLNINRDPKRDHNFDNHPCLGVRGVRVLCLGLIRL